MRSLFIALLIVLFAGVHTAAAFSNAHAGSTATEQPAQAVDGASDAVQAAFSHHAKCCEKSGKSGSTAKIYGCSADCVSLHVDSIVHRFSAEATLEAPPLPELSALKPDPHIRPPKHI